MRIVIAGAGAMGQMLGLFLQKGGSDVFLVVRRAEVKDKIEKTGLSFTKYGEDKPSEGPLNVKVYAGEEGIRSLASEKEMSRGADVVFVMTKGTDTERIAGEIKPLLGRDTAVVSLQNGLGNVDIIRKYVSEDNIFYGCMNLSCTVSEPGVLSGSLFDGVNVYIGSCTRGRRQEKTGRSIAEALSKGGLSAEYTDDIDREVWLKLLVNIAVNATCGLVRLRGGEAGTDPDFISVSVDMVKEAIAVAAKMGVNIDFGSFMSETLPRASKTSGAHYPSMAQDMMMRRVRTEIDFINGAVARLGEKMGVPTPVNSTVARLVRAYQNNYLKQYYPKASSSGGKPVFDVTVEPKYCKNCLYCVKYCPAKVFESTGRVVEAMNPSSCVGCMNCVAVCPEGAITISK